ncbi:Proline iminopeptidase [Penicillium paradoxum]|uniref:Proline iminopeptidase n=1 Tax=Penicillium paradoxum TaxID=176176 RepID=UPI0025468A83|nr:Proline iminopeptidase [Penicillium paradoxum]KAJ5773788.1 Proline iminopeptidase [Penicillium paradoxum]
MQSNQLHPGTHAFHVPAKQLTFEYVVHRSPSTEDKATQNVIVVQCPGWGLGSEYLQNGLQGLWKPNSDPNTTNPMNTVIFFHPRGTDGSSRPPASQMSSMPDLASDLEDLRQHLHLEKYPVLLGHSNGGAIALGYAQIYPSRVGKLILLDHQLVGVQDKRLLLLEGTRIDARYQAAWDRMSDRQGGSDEEFTESVRGMWPLYFFDPGRYVPELLRDIGERKLSVWCYEAQGRCDKKLGHRMLMVEGLKDVRAKTLMLFGREDMICGIGIAERTIEGIPDARVIIYDECGHFPWIERKEQTILDIRKFIEEKRD